MTAKDYVSLAAIINTHFKRSGADAQFLEELCICLQKDNPRFNLNRFKLACRKEY